MIIKHGLMVYPDENLSSSTTQIQYYYLAVHFITIITIIIIMWHVYVVFKLDRTVVITVARAR